MDTALRATSQHVRGYPSPLHALVGLRSRLASRRALSVARSLLAQSVRLATFGYLLVTLFPGEFWPIGTGLDWSWQFGLNYLSLSQYVYGRDFVYTYGPLGYLFIPKPIGDNLAQSVTFWLFVHCLFAILIGFWIFQAKLPWQSITFVTAYVIANLVGLLYEYHLLIILALLLALAIQHPRIATESLFCGGILAFALAFLKFSLGVAAVAMLGAAVVGSVLVASTAWWRPGLAAVAGYAIGALALSTLFLRSPANFLAWVAASLQMVQGFDIAPSTERPENVAVLGIVGLTVSAVLLTSLAVQRLRLALVGLILAGPMAMSFKHAFVRQDGHITIFFPFLLGCTAVLMLTSRRSRELHACMAAFLLLIVLALPIGSLFGTFSYGSVTDFVAGVRGWARIQAMADLSGTERRLARESARNLENVRLPPAWLATLGEKGGTVDIAPWELSYVAANDLRWKPSPLLQTYLANTRFLDEWNASHFGGLEAPSFMIVDYVDIDGRNPLVAAPATWRAILNNYEEVPVERRGHTLLLRRREAPTIEDARLLREDRADIRGWVEVPESDKLLYAEMNLELTAWGRMMKALYRVPPILLLLQFDDGQYGVHRLIPDTARNGMLINYLPRSTDAFGELLRGRANSRVRRFRVTGPGADYFQGADARLVWRETPPRIAYRASEHLSLDGLRYVPRRAEVGISSVNNEPLVANQARARVDAFRHAFVSINGWALDVGARTAASTVVIEASDGLQIPTMYGSESPNVPPSNTMLGVKGAGFRVSFPVALLGRGVHVLRFKVLLEDASAYDLVDRTLTLEIV